MPKAVIAAVPGWAAGGGHSLNVVCDLSLASIEHARFKQTDADVGSFDAGYGSALLARQIGDKRAREIFFLARTYDAVTAERWGVVNEAVPHAELEERALEYAATVAGKSPQAIRMLKLAFNLADDGLAGQQVFAGEATRLAYMTDEAVEGRDAFLHRRTPDWSPFPYYTLDISRLIPHMWSEPPPRPHMRDQARYIEGIQNCGENCGEYRNEENDLNGDRTFEILH